MTITRSNWKDHVTEPPLTDEEWEQVFAMRRNYRVDSFLANAIDEATKQEWKAEQKASSMHTEDWSDVAAWMSAYWRLRRAEVGVWMKLTQQRETEVLCTGYPDCGFSDCPHAVLHEPHVWEDGVTCIDEDECRRWQQRAGIGPKKSWCRCIELPLDKKTKDKGEQE